MLTTHILKYLISFFVIGTLFVPIMIHAQQNLDWKQLKFSEINENEFVIEENGIINILMNNSSSLLYRKILDSEKETSTLNWQWKIEKGFPATSMVNSKKDDRPVAIHIWFPKTKSDKNKGFKEFFGRLLGYDFPGRVITYVWGGTEDYREIIENPHFKERGFIIIQKPGSYKTDDWEIEQVNFREDYRNIFNEDAPNPTHVAVSGDSDHSHVEARASVKLINFSNSSNHISNNN